MTFGQKSSKLNSRSVYCSQLYGTYTCYTVVLSCGSERKKVHGIWPSPSLDTIFSESEFTFFSLWTTAQDHCCCLVRPSPSAFSIEFYKNSNVICFYFKQEICVFITSQKRCHWNSLIIYICQKNLWKADGFSYHVLYHQVFPLKDWLRRITTLLLYGMMERYYRRNVQRLAVGTQIG